MKTKAKKLLSILLTLCMLLSVVPMMAFTASAKVYDTFTYTYEGQTLTYAVQTEDGNTGTVCVAKGSKPTGALIIPSEVKNGGITYTVTDIGKEAFNNVTGLTSVVIPDTVTDIQNSGFSSCSGLTSVTLSASLKYLWGNAFSYCSKLTSISLPDSLEYIGGISFSGCAELKTVTIPDSVTSISYSAFKNCTNLESFHIGKSVAYIEWGIFGGSTKLKNITVDAQNPYFCVEDSKILFSKDKKTLLAYPSATGDYTIPNGVTEIRGAFEGCTGLKTVKIPDSVTTIGDCSFRSCTGLTSVDIPDSVTDIGNYAFTSCTALSTVKLGNSVSAIRARAFLSCTQLTSITIPASVKYIGGDAFNQLSFGNATFSGDELPCLATNSFKSNTTSISEDTNHTDSDVTVEIVGFNNGKNNSDAPFYAGQLLKPVVSGYDGTAPLYYRFEVDVGTVQSLYTSDASKYYDQGGDKSLFFKDEAYAIIQCNGTTKTTPTYIKCSVYTVEKGNDGKFAATLLASKQVTLSLGAYENATLEANAQKRFSTDNILIMEQGESTALIELLAKTGCPHLYCQNTEFKSVTTSAYGDNPITVEELSGGNRYSLITAKKDAVGLSKVTFKFCSTHCSSFGDVYFDITTGAVTPHEFTMYIYVVAAPKFTATHNSITVTDNTAATAISTYQIGLNNTAKVSAGKAKLTGLKEKTEYDVLQTLSVNIGGVISTGTYHNYVTTKSYKGVTAVDITKSTTTLAVGESETLATTVSPTDASDPSLTWSSDKPAIATVDENGKVTAVSKGTATITVTTTDGNKTANCTVTVLPDAMKNAGYGAALALDENVDIYITVKNITVDADMVENLSITCGSNTFTLSEDDIGKTAVTFDVASKNPTQMAEKVHVVISYDGVVCKQFDYSVRAYYDKVFEVYGEDSALSKLCLAALAYGGAAQVYFGYDTENLCDSGLERRVLSTFEEYAEDEPGQIANGFTAGTNVTAVDPTMVLGSSTALKFYIHTPNTYTKADFVVMNNLGEVVDPQNIALSEKEDGAYTLTIKNISASKLARTYTITINGVDSSEFSYTYGAYEYCRKAMNQTESETLASLAMRMYIYGQTAQAYAN
ncbi:MAG TPA: hypothetical protein DDY98_03485 [Ruminococcaceae bacterium]|nr:hypothetical protein [Oscillospiraceae bacterium]